MQKYLAVTYDNTMDKPYLNVGVLDFYTPKNACCTERVVTTINEFRGKEAEELYNKLVGNGKSEDLKINS